MKHCEKQKVWQTIVKEARELSEQEPMLASFYHATIIKHDSLSAALSYILANKLNTLLQCQQWRSVKWLKKR